MPDLNPFTFQGRLTKAQWKRQVPLFAVFLVPLPVTGIALASQTAGDVGVWQVWLVRTALVLAAAVLVWAAITRRFRDAGFGDPGRAALIGVAVPVIGWGWLVWQALRAPSVEPGRGKAGWQRPDPAKSTWQEQREDAAPTAQPTRGPDPTRNWDRALDIADRTIGGDKGPDEPVESAKSWAEQVDIPPYDPDGDNRH